MSVVISVESLCKSYRLGTINTGTFRGDVHRWWAKLRGQPDPHLKIGEKDHGNRDGETIWALNDVNLEVKQGEVLGIIGKNGAGKSTLLKILSRVTAPTSGEVKVKGRIASLLEVGTGFHPELTGRENIYLNGVILGMKKAEIARKFDEIVDFSGVEQFIDTPVKRYSSGMYVRLAFAVAAHLDPEILVVDEVLAVGDAEFQKKCLGKMGDVAHAGRTVLFVSHNMAAITQLCTQGILFNSGTTKAIGTADDVVREYLTVSHTKKHKINLVNYKERHGSGEVVFESASIQNDLHDGCRDFSIGDDICIVISIKVCSQYVNKKIKLAVELRCSDGLNICNMIDVDSNFRIEYLQERETLSLTLSDIRLYPDTYFISLWAGSITSTDTFDHVVDCLSFDIVDGGKLTSRHLPRRAGILFITPEWKMHRDEYQGI